MDTHNFKEEDIPFVKMKLKNFKAPKFDLVFHPKMKDWKKENIKSVLKALCVENFSYKNSELQLKEW